MQPVPTLLTKREFSQIQLMHILVADWTVVLRARDPFLAASAVRGGRDGRGRRGGGLARRFRVGFADPGVRERVGRDGGLGEDLGEFGGEEGSVGVCWLLLFVREIVSDLEWAGEWGRGLTFGTSARTPGSLGGLHKARSVRRRLRKR